MKKFFAASALALVMSSNVFAVSIVQTVASPFLTVAASLQTTIASPFISTGASVQGKEVLVAAQVKQEIAVYEVTNEIGYALQAMIDAYQEKYDVSVEDAIFMIEYNANDVLVNH